jgi:hypothetical protein
LVTVPESEGTDQPEQEVTKEPAAHTEIQWLLLKLGSDMGFSVWVARNDRGRSFGAHRFAELPTLKTSLPLQFDDATNRTIELIDVLWLNRNSIVAAFRDREHDINLFGPLENGGLGRDAAELEHPPLSSRA